MAKLSLILLSAPIACIGLSVPAAAAAAADEGDGERRTVVVRYNDLNLTSVEGRDRLSSRVKAAVRTVCIGPNDDMEARRAEIRNAIRDVDSGDGAIVLTDLFGGTPSNLAISLMEAGKVEVIAGINLPMLIRLAGARKAMSIVDAVAAARDAGRNYITVASEFLGQDA